MFGASGRLISRTLKGAHIVVGELAIATDVDLLPGAADPFCPRDGVVSMDLLRACVLASDAQLVSREAGMTLILPEEARSNAPVWRWLSEHVAGNGPIRALEIVDVRESMANGGGPACLRLRVVADPATVDPRFLLSGERADLIERIIARHWPEQIDPGDLGNAALTASVTKARRALLEALELAELG